MGTHPIFESDFDCLTEYVQNYEMSKKGGKSTPSGKEKEKSRITPSNEFIPGIADAEWLVFQETELRDVTVAAVLGEIIDESLNEIVDRHTSARAIDTAVNDVMGILSDAMRLHFITHDAEPLILNDDPAPKPTKTDSWARGRIPVVLNSTTRLKESVSRVSTGANGQLGIAGYYARRFVPRNVATDKSRKCDTRAEYTGRYGAYFLLPLLLLLLLLLPPLPMPM